MTKEITKEDERFVDGDTIKVQGILEYPKLGKNIDTGSPTAGFVVEPQWNIQFIPSAEDVKELAALGFNIRTKEDGTQYTTLRKKCKTREGTEMRPPAVVNPDLSTFEEPERIGNGTLANVSIYCIYRMISGSRQLCTYLNALQIVSLKEYSQDTGDFEDLSDKPSF